MPKTSFLYKNKKKQVELIPWPVGSQAGFLSNWAITMVSEFKPIVFFFRFSPLKCLYNYIILNIFQIMYLIIGMYNTKTEPVMILHMP